MCVCEKKGKKEIGPSAQNHRRGKGERRWIGMGSKATSEKEWRGKSEKK
jgi:hypothetical protein